MRRLYVSVWLVASFLLLPGCYWASPSNVGLQNGQLKPCPDTPNCVSSYSGDSQAVEPIAFSKNLDRARKDLIDQLRSKYGASIRVESDTYVHATVSTTLGFVDDLEFLFEPESKEIHVRSASRVGYDDMGTNRERIQALRQHFAKSLIP